MSPSTLEGGGRDAYALSEDVRRLGQAELSVVSGEYACTLGLSAKWTCSRP